MSVIYLNYTKYEINVFFKYYFFTRVATFHFKSVSEKCCSGMISCTKMSVLMKVCIIIRLFSLMVNMQVSTVCSIYPWVRHPTDLSHC